MLGKVWQRSEVEATCIIPTLIDYCDCDTGSRLNVVVVGERTRLLSSARQGSATVDLPQPTA